LRILGLSYLDDDIIARKESSCMKGSSAEVKKYFEKSEMGIEVSLSCLGLRL